MFHTHKNKFLAAAILTCIASNASAQWTLYKSNLLTKSISKSTSRFMGNQYLGGYSYAATRLSARKDRWTARADTSFGFNSSIRFLNTSNRMLYFRAAVHSDNYTSRRNTGSAYIYVGSNLILNRSFSGRGSHHVMQDRTNLDVFPSDITCPFSVAGIPITVRGNVGVGLRVNVKPNLADGRVSLVGYLRSNSHATVSAHCGRVGALARAEVTADFGDPTLSAALHGDAVSWRFAANVTYATQVITLRLRATLQYFYSWRASTMSYWRAAAQSISLLKL